jgi:hypothetical protein
MPKIYLLGAFPARRETICLECARTLDPPADEDDPDLRPLRYDDLDDVIGWTCTNCGAEDEDLKTEAERRYWENQREELLP